MSQYTILILDPKQAADLIWEAKRDALGPGFLAVWIGTSMNDPMFVGTHTPILPNGTAVEIGESITGTLPDGSRYRINKWTAKPQPTPRRQR